MSLRTPATIHMVTDSDSLQEACRKSFHDCSNVDMNGESFVCVGYKGGGDTFELREFVCVTPDKPLTSAWVGVGLPPVGIECERMWVSGPPTYIRVRVIAHDDGQAIYRFMEDRRKGQVQADKQGDGDSCGNPIFRPIRTPEQIAAQEIQAIRDEIGYQRQQLGICPIEAMYKLGYRKFEIVEE